MLEGFLENRCLQELHLDRQQLRPGEPLVLDPRCCLALAPSLNTLNLAHSNLHDMTGVEQLARLERLELAGNLLSSLPSLLHTLARLSMLSSLSLQDNPGLGSYRTPVIAAARALTRLDSKAVEPSTRVLAAQLGRGSSRRHQSGQHRQQQQQQVEEEEEEASSSSSLL